MASFSSMSAFITAYRFSGNVAKSIHRFCDSCYGICGHPSWQMYPPLLILQDGKTDLQTFQVLDRPIALSSPCLDTGGLAFINARISLFPPASVTSSERNLGWLPVRTCAICLGFWDGHGPEEFSRTVQRCGKELPLSVYPEKICAFELSLSHGPWEGISMKTAATLPVRKHRS
ncbi:MAG: hypothetical protein JXB03_12400 [Spirochaetales bacterium]|nr:hypothetical protein [Spirochaetales bacterium]